MEWKKERTEKGRADAEESSRTGGRFNWIFELGRGEGDVCFHPLVGLPEAGQAKL